MTLLGAFGRYARAHPEREAIRFLANGEDATSRITYGELHRAMQEVAAGIADRGFAGKPVVLALAPGIEFAIAMLACLRAGAFAVTIPFPVHANATQRVATIITDARPAAVIVDGFAHVPAAVTLGEAPVFTLEALRAPGGSDAEPAPSVPALIQYSSGSTRAPCGVVITHGNLRANLEMLRGAFGIDEGEVGVSWLPPSHDMGLIGTIFTPLFTGGTAVLMPPAAFIARPIRWLRAIDRYRSGISGGPNFAFEICDRRIASDAASELDLSCWRVAFCGAEPIRAQTLERFARRFEVAHFSRERYLACYGLAEATLLVSSGPLREAAPASGASPRVSAGRTPSGCAVRVGDSGELFVSGDHVSPGSWSGLRCCVVPWTDSFEDRGERFVATGDVGAVVDGEIFVLERKKDVMALYGRKIHAIDAEQAALDASDCLVAAACAFAVETERGERLVVLCEIGARDLRSLDPAATRTAIARAVSATTGIVPEVAFVRSGFLHRTPSGKIVRQACRSDYLAGAIS